MTTRPELLMHPALHAPACAEPAVHRYRSGKWVITTCVDPDCGQVVLRPAH